MNVIYIAIVVAAGYLLGSLSISILLSKNLLGRDVRRHGSGNAGATNMARVFGMHAGLLTLAGDMLKAAAAMLLGFWLLGDTGMALGGVACLLGHCFPALHGFKGGKGVLVAGGTILAIQPVLIPFLAVIFLACLLPTGMVSLGSVTMAALYPVLTILYGVFRGYSAADLTVCAIGSVIMGAMVIYMHRSNIQRIREGKEYRFGRHGKK